MIPQLAGNGLSPSSLFPILVAPENVEVVQTRRRHGPHATGGNTGDPMNLVRPSPLRLSIAKEVSPSDRHRVRGVRDYLADDPMAVVATEMPAYRGHQFDVVRPSPLLLSIAKGESPSNQLLAPSLQQSVTESQTTVRAIDAAGRHP